MKIKILQTIFLLVIFISFYSYGEDKTLNELKRKFDTANTQTELNMTSYKISQFLEQKLIKLEVKIKKKLKNKRLELFIKSSQLWRGYRAAEVSFEGEFYSDGSIQPLIHNTAFASITEHRIALLNLTLKELHR